MPVQIERIYEPWQPDNGYRMELVAHRDQLSALRHRAREGTLTIIFAARAVEHSSAAVLAEALAGSPDAWPPASRSSPDERSRRDLGRSPVHRPCEA
jgi:uncharacterized protein YeaO (DUF488 family)